ncbi:hypothetical protein CASFOL_003998 [Castilleja foliolosa]|uniref:Uncharacterized protein n=1 Tax=Castilleja foliolosa TaxID=1961234 RepID=A0ABD3EIT9_9LAMI
MNRVGRRIVCHQTGQWNVMNKIRMINGGIIFCVITVLNFFVRKRAEMAKNQIDRLR